MLTRLQGKLKIPISIDTSKSDVAEAAAQEGAEIINDVTALRADPRLAEIARRRKLPLILMHMRGELLHHAENFARDVIRDVIMACAAPSESRDAPGWRNRKSCLRSWVSGSVRLPKF